MSAYTLKGFRKSLYNPTDDPHRALVESIGPAYAEYRVEWEQTTSLELERDFPVQLDIELNVSCNLKCPMCTWSIEAGAGEGKSSWMPFEFYQHLVTEGVARGLRAVNLNYVNEPLIRRDIPKFVKFAREAGAVEVMFNTNGTIFNDDLGRELIEAGLTKISFSLDAFTEPTYRKVRIGGDYTKVMKNVHRFLEIRKELGSKLPIVKLTFLRMSDNEHELEPFIEYWRDKVELFSIQNLYNPFDGELGRERAKHFVNGHPGQVAGTPRCPSPFQRATVRSNGDVLPCCNMRAAETLVMGNINRTPLADIWNSDNMKHLRMLHKTGRYAENAICKACIENSDAWAPEPR